MSNVYDTASGLYLLIPQGSRIVGTYNSRVSYGQNGIQVAWNRIIFPDASAVDLAGMNGLDAQGNSGLRDKVDCHCKQLFGFAVLTSMFDAALAITQNRQRSVLVYPSATQEAESAAGREVSQLGTQITRKNLNVQPTITIPVGTSSTCALIETFCLRNHICLLSLPRWCLALKHLGRGVKKRRQT